MNLRVAVVYTTETYCDNQMANPRGEEQMNNTNTSLEKAITELGHEAILVPGNFDLLNRIMEVNPDVIFNNCTGITDKSTQPQIAGMLELTNIPFTGSSQTAHTLALYKPLAKQVLSFNDIPTPSFTVINHVEEEFPDLPPFPVIIKPEHEGSSIGISEKSIAYSSEEAKKTTKSVINEYKQPALIEEFIIGREFTVGILGGRQQRILPPMEILLNKESDIYFREVKVNDDVRTVCPADIDPDLLRRIEASVLGAFQALGCRDYARIDVRVDSKGIPYVIDVNTLPGLEPGYSDFPRTALGAGLSYNQIIEYLLQCALERKTQ